MRVFLRRVRGIFGMALTWSGVWAGAGAIFGVLHMYLRSLLQPELSFGDGAGVMALLGFIQFGVYGFAIGSLFAAVLAIAERRRRLEQLNTWRIAVWGGIAGTLVPLAHIVAVRLVEGVMLGDGIQVTFVSAALGAASAAGALKIAQAGQAAPQADPQSDTAAREAPMLGAKWESTSYRRGKERFWSRKQQ
jgi:ABC-type Na+ efflux pump permease subunit